MGRQLHALAVAGAVVASVGLLAAVHWHRRKHSKRSLAVDGRPQHQLDTLVEIKDLAKLNQICHLASDMQLGRHVTSLVIRDAGPDLALIHPVVGRMTALVKLDLSGSSIYNLPFFLSELQQLQELSMARCQLNSIPGDIGSLTGLRALDLSSNQICRVPDGLCKLTGLTSLNLMCNSITQLPAEIGQLSQVRLLGLKSNQLTSLPDSFTRLVALVELFITGNRLTTLPHGFGALTSLVKLQASFNAFTHLPRDMVQLPNLEMMRVAVCRLGRLPTGRELWSGLPTGLPEASSQAPAPSSPDQLSTAPDQLSTAPDQLSTSSVGGKGLTSAWPRLAWISLGGNPACSAAPTPRLGLKLYCASDLQLTHAQGGVHIFDTRARATAKLGEGASGEVFKATLIASGHLVAVKQFRADVSPDGRTQEEVGVACAVDHPHLTRVLGILLCDPPSPPLAADDIIRDYTGSAMAVSPSGEPPLLVMEVCSGTPLAAKPTSAHLLRCKWESGTSFTAHQCLQVAKGTASALAYLHALNISHGDVYAHNCLVDRDTWHATLCDFGASFMYQACEAEFHQAVEVRAWGLLLKDMVDRLQLMPGQEATGKSLQQVVSSCLDQPPSSRPSFEHLCRTLATLQ